MNELPSTTFRKVYASLRAPTRVTVNGHIIGTWTPSLVPNGFEEEIVRSLGLDPKEVRAEFGQRPVEFRPVPKPGKGK